MKPPLLLRLYFLAVLLPLVARADVKLPAIISDRMVLERSTKVPLWGKADPNEEVTVSFAGQSARAVADAAGNWRVALDLSKAPAGPLEMSVVGKNKITLSDVVVGEVWLASGQSNMEWTVEQSLDAAATIANSENPMIRQFLVKKLPSRDPLDDTEGTWVVASPATTAKFSAVGYAFANKLERELKVPIGIVHSSWGGTPSEAWTSAEAMDSVPDLKEARLQQWDAIGNDAERKRVFTEGFAAWLQANGRADRPSADLASFAGADVPTEGWVPVKIPGRVQAKGLPDAGIVWLRKDIAIDKKGSLELSAPIDGFASIYWNGKLLSQNTYKDFPDSEGSRREKPLKIAQSDVREGNNVLAIRVCQPIQPATFRDNPKVGSISLNGDWLAKAEVDFPPLDASAKAAPQPPSNPPALRLSASYLFNGMINPIIPYAISGVIWYQGEANAGRAYQYRTAFPLLIKDWRKKWNQGDVPFYFCQLANFQDKESQPGESEWAELREAQSLALQLPNTGQAVLVDLGEAKDIHPRNKKDVGERLAAIALAQTYGKDVPFSGPVYDSVEFASGKASLRFRHTDGGLVAKPLPATHVLKSVDNESAPLARNAPKSELEGFALCGSDQKWFWANAKIDGDQVIVWSDAVASPVAVRYAWANNPTCNLYNGAGFPAAPLRTDDFPMVTRDKKFK